MIKKCIYPKCGKEFETEKATQEYCSGACIAKEKKDKAAAKKKPKKKGRAAKAISKPRNTPTVMEEENKPDRLPDGVMANAPEVLPVIGIDPNPPNVFDGEKTETTSDEPELKFQKPPEPWIASIESYCESVGIFPQDLIEFHRNANKPAKKKESGPVLNYFQQRQQRMMGE